MLNLTTNNSVSSHLIKWIDKIITEEQNTTRELKDSELLNISGGRNISDREYEEIEKWAEYCETNFQNGKISKAQYDDGINAIGSYQAAIYYHNPPKEDFLFKLEDWIGTNKLPWEN